jgi:hypothetical protein
VRFLPSSDGGSNAVHTMHHGRRSLSFVLSRTGPPAVVCFFAPPARATWTNKFEWDARFGCACMGRADSEKRILSKAAKAALI